MEQICKRRLLEMKLRSKICIVTITALAALFFILLSTDYQNAAAQYNSGKKTADKSTAKSDTALVTFVEIGAARCIPCKAMQPIMKAVAEEYKGQVKVLFYDVWTQQGKVDAEKYNIRIIPTQVFLDKNGKEYFRHEGYFPKEEVVKTVKMKGVR
jgi:thioredoxin